MNLSDYLTHIRKYVLRDTAKPPMWPDALIIRRLGEALSRLSTRTHLLVNADREIELEAGVDTYPLDEDVVFVSAGRLAGFTTPLATSTEHWTPNDGAVSRPVRFTLDRETQSVRFYPSPDTNYTTILRVARMPRELSENDMSVEVEVNRKYELVPADWVAYRCFSDPDADGFNPGEAEKAKARFDLAVLECKRDVYRLRTGNSMRVHGQRVK